MLKAMKGMATRGVVAVGCVLGCGSERATCPELCEEPGAPAAGGAARFDAGGCFADAAGATACLQDSAAPADSSSESPKVDDATDGATDERLVEAKDAPSQDVADDAGTHDAVADANGEWTPHCSQGQSDGGRPCDDADACSAGDECGPLACTAARSIGVSNAVGSVWSFGGKLDDSPGFTTVSAWLADDRILFADAARDHAQLTLVGVRGDTLDVLDQKTTQLRVESGQIGNWTWTHQLLTQIAVLGVDRFAIVASGGMDVFRVAGDRMQHLEYSKLASEKPRAVLGRGDEVWACGPKLARFVVDADGTAHEAQASTSDCRALAFSQDPQMLFVGSDYDLQLVHAETLETKQIVETGRTFYRLARAGTYLVAQQIDSGMGPAFGDIRVFATDTLDLVGTVPYAGDGVGVPIGFVASDQGLVVERFTPSRTDQASLSAESYVVSSAGLTKTGEVPFFDRSYNAALPFRDLVQPAGRNQHLVLEPAQQIARIDWPNSTLIPITGRSHGAFDMVRTAGPRQVVVQSWHSAHRVDLSDPAAPAVLEGGTVLPASQPLRIELESDAGPARLLTVPGGWGRVEVPGERDRVSLLRAEAEGVPAPAGSILAKGPAQLLVANGSLHHFMADADGALQYRRFSLRGLGGSEDQEPTADQDVRLELPARTDLAIRLRWTVQADEHGDIVVVEARAKTTSDSASVTSMHWLTPTPQGYQVRASGVCPHVVEGFQVAGGRALLFGASQVSLLQINDHHLTTLAQVDLGDYPETTQLLRLLSFDGKRAYLAGVRRSLFSEEERPVVLALRSDNLSVVARYATPDIARSMADLPGKVVFATGMALVVAPPPCNP